MAQIFHRSTNTLSKVSILSAVFVAAGLLGIFMIIDRAGYTTRKGVTLIQPVPFSHEHHVAGLGIDCRYCHTSVEKSATAGIPPTSTCYNCHKLIWKDSPMLEPVRASYKTGEPIHWTKVHDLPDFAYFNHSIHVAKGVGCVECHGRVDKMPLMRSVNPLQMRWCLDCHRNPEPHLRPKDEVFSMTWKSDEPDLGARLAKDYQLRGTQDLTSCNTCHR
ncbi:MAG TPA: cytochrome c3 family protein [Polyangiaceae bacterium]|nr:cytochrome c3 family protein [Polyangiaceae bacterium]